MFEKEAREYVRKIRHDVINWDGKEPEERFYNEIKFKQAYLAGAEFGYNKENEWHDLHKDPDDVPNDYRYVWTNVGAGYHDDGWYDDFGRLQNVIAWCEPKFKE